MYTLTEYFIECYISSVYVLLVCILQNSAVLYTRKRLKLQLSLQIIKKSKRNDIQYSKWLGKKFHLYRVHMDITERHRHAITNTLYHTIRVEQLHYYVLLLCWCCTVLYSDVDTYSFVCNSSAVPEKFQHSPSNNFIQELWSMYIGSTDWWLYTMIPFYRLKITWCSQ